MLNALTSCKNLTSPESQSKTGHVTRLDDDDAEHVADVNPSNISTISTDLLNLESDLFSPWIDASTISLSNMALASFWLQSCMRQHRVCTDLQKPSRLPNRIIDISDPQKPILSDGLGRDEPYVTLSYKWGEARRYITTSKNLAQHTKQGIPLSELPQTFKDGIFVASSLGFRWIWIDALCICQDFTHELIQEMNRMDQTFQASTLTVFAAAGDDADAGLMSVRDPRWVKPCKLAIKATLDGKTTEGAAYISLDGGEWTHAPLYRRGWYVRRAVARFLWLTGYRVLQEQVLAHRGLIFESRQLRWRCLCGTASEADPSRTSIKKIESIQDMGVSQYDRWILYPEGHDGFNYLRMWIQQKNPMPDRTPWQRDNQYDAWYSMVTEYNSRALTHESDVLLALAGLSSAMATTHGCTYYTGLWKEDLQTGLCWFVTDTTRRSSDAQVNDKSSFPTWSWVSQRGNNIKFRGWENNHTVIKHEGLSLFEHYTDRAPKPDNPFTTINPKQLMVTGKLRKIAIEKLSKRDSNWQDSTNKSYEELSISRWVWRVRDIKTDEKLGHIAFDFDPASFEPRHVYCLLCIAREKYGEWQLTCLGLVPTDETLEEFKRIGLIMLRPKNWYGMLRRFDPKDESSPSVVRESIDTRYCRTIRII